MFLATLFKIQKKKNFDIHISQLVIKINDENDIITQHSQQDSVLCCGRFILNGWKIQSLDVESSFQPAFLHTTLLIGAPSPSYRCCDAARGIDFFLYQPHYLRIYIFSFIRPHAPLLGYDAEAISSSPMQYKTSGRSSHLLN